MRYIFSKDKLKELYNDLLTLESFEKLGAKYNIKGETLKRRLKSAGYTVDNNENYFSCIDDEYKAYYLGLLYADGCVTKVKSNQLVISLTLVESDGYILSKLNQETRAYKTLKIYSQGSSISKNRVCRWSMSSNKMAKDLELYYIVPNKTYKKEVHLPKIEDFFIPHYLRGLLDGDGSVMSRKNSNLISVNFLATSKSLIEDISTYLITKQIRTKVRENKKGTITNLGKRTLTLYTCVIEDTQSVINLYNLLYNNSNIYLERKKNKFHIETLYKIIEPHKGKECPICNSTYTWKRGHSYKQTNYYVCKDCGVNFIEKVSGNTVLTYVNKSA